MTQADTQMLKFLERAQQVRDRAAPAVQPTDQHHVDFTVPRGGDQGLAQLALGSTAANLFDLENDGPASLEGALAHGAGLEEKRLLIVGGNAGG